MVPSLSHNPVFRHGAWSLSLLIALPLALCAGEVSDDPGAFADAMLAKRKEQLASLDQAKAGSFKVTTTAPITGNDAATPISVDIAAVDTLYLYAKGPNGTGSCHAVWGEPVLIDKQGGRTRLGSLPVLGSAVGWAELAKDVFDGKPLQIKDRVLSHGLFAHADSVISFKVERKYTRFEALVGINRTSGGNGRVVFTVDSVLHSGHGEPPWAAEMARRHPVLYASFRSDFGNDAGRWLETTDATIDRAVVARVLDKLGDKAGSLRATFDSLDKGKVAWSDPRWMQLYAQGVQMGKAVETAAEDVDSVRKAAAFIKRYVPASDFTKEIDALAKEVAAANPADAAAKERNGQKIRTLRRKILFTHPGLNFDKLLVNIQCPPQYSHNVDQYLGRHSKEGPGLAVLENWKSETPAVRYLTKDKLPPGATRHPDLSYDAKKVLFAYCDHTETKRELRRFWIWELTLDGSAPPRQITGTAKDAMVRDDSRMTVLMEDFDPTYLPDGGMVFTSTRCQNFGRCHAGRYTPSFYLYRGELDASNIKPMSYGEANEITPAVLNDGRLVFNRWDYINRHDCQFHKLWITNPDGTFTGNYWGNLTNNPLSVAEPRAIPNSTKIMCTASAHHSFTAGTILVIDTNKGTEGEAPLTHLTPEVKYPECQGWPDTTYLAPYPITEDLFFAGYSTTKHISQGHIQKDDAYSLVLVFNIDGKAYREPIFAAPGFSCWSPTPLVARSRPPVLPSRLPHVPDSRVGVGTFTVKNVYESTQKIEPGSVKWLRVNEIVNQPSARVAHRGWVMDEVTKKEMGIVPVEADGSVSFRAPSGKPLQLQILDQDKMAILTMRTFIYLQPNEITSCTGCHEERGKAPSSGYSSSRGSAIRPARDLTPGPGPQQDDGFNYVAQVQPVLDRNCISCHGLGKTEGNCNLLGTYLEKETGRYPSGKLRMPTSYDWFVSRKEYFKMLDRNAEPASSTPHNYYAFCSKLPTMLKAGHQGVKLDDDGLRRVITWLDLNGQLYGNYSHNRPESRLPSVEGEKALRAEIASRFGKELAAQPFEALVNNAVTTESRILKSPLAVAAGGWGQIKGGWTATSDAGYQKMLKLVEASLTPQAFQDKDGTCGRGEKKCVCGVCWVREAEEKYRLLKLK